MPGTCVCDIGHIRCLCDVTTVICVCDHCCVDDTMPWERSNPLLCLVMVTKASHLHN